MYTVPIINNFFITFRPHTGVLNRKTWIQRKVGNQKIENKTIRVKDGRNIKMRPCDVTSADGKFAQNRQRLEEAKEEARLVLNLFLFRYDSLS